MTIVAAVSGVARLIIILQQALWVMGPGFFIVSWQAGDCHKSMVLMPYTVQCRSRNFCLLNFRRILFLLLEHTAEKKTCRKLLTDVTKIRDSFTIFCGACQKNNGEVQGSIP